MADGTYVGMSGAAARAAQLESVADNLANAQTAGFKASRAAFQAVLAEASEGQLTHAAAVGTGFDLRSGPTVVTGQPTDVLPEEGAFLTVRLPDGRRGFTRDGRLTVTPEGQVLAGRYPVLSADDRPIVAPPGAPISVGRDGMVMSDGAEVGRLALARLEGDVRREEGSVLSVGASGRAVPVEVAVRIGHQELSNGSALEAAVQLVTAQRNFDASMQAVQTYRRMDERANELGKSR